MLYLPGILTTVAYLMGEKSVNTSTSGPRTEFVQKSLEEAYHAYPWRFARRSTQLAISNGIATLPTNYDYSMAQHAHYFDDSLNQVDMTEIDPLDKGGVRVGENIYWITSPSEGTFVLNTKDNVATVSFVYQTLPPALDTAGTIGTAYPAGMTIALGARRFVKLGQNPDADISQEQTQFETALANDVATTQVPAPRKKRRSVSGTTGDF